MKRFSVVKLSNPIQHNPLNWAGSLGGCLITQINKEMLAFSNAYAAKSHADYRNEKMDIL